MPVRLSYATRTEGTRCQAKIVKTKNQARRLKSNSRDVWRMSDASWLDKIDPRVTVIVYLLRMTRELQLLESSDGDTDSRTKKQNGAQRAWKAVS